jgi:hypothetical protein
VTTASKVVAERVVRCPFSVAHEYADGFFRQAAEEGAQVGVPLRALVPTLGGGLRQPVRLEVARRPDPEEPGRAHDAFEVDWTAATRFFPDYHGRLAIRIESVELSRLTLTGEYRPPFGPLGAIFDRLIGRRIAGATMRDLLDRLGDAMEAREASFRGETVSPQGSGTTA